MGLSSETYLALILGLAVHCGSVWSSGRPCNPNNPPTLKRITIDMIAKRWFTQSALLVVPNNALPASHFMTVFNLDFRSSGKLVVNGRTAYQPQNCLYNVVNINIDPKRASFTAFIGYLANTIEHRILDTDFRNWMIIWLCYRVDPNDPNNCTDFLTDHLTLRVDGILSRRAKKQLERALQKTVCRRELPPRIPDPKRVCDRLGKPSKSYGRKRDGW